MLVRCCRSRHQDVIDINPIETEFAVESPRNDKSAFGIQPLCSFIRRKNTQSDTSATTTPYLFDSCGNEQLAEAQTLTIWFNSETIDFPDMVIRFEFGWPANLNVARNSVGIDDD